MDLLAVRASPPTAAQWHVYNIYFIILVFYYYFNIKSSNQIGSVKLPLSLYILIIGTQDANVLQRGLVTR
jgi:hypothetical protein